MARRLAISSIVIAALAVLVIPALAGAAPVLTDPKGTKLPFPVLVEETLLRGKATNTPFGTIECKRWTFKNEVTENSGSSIKEVGVGGETEGCEAGGTSITITGSKVTKLSITTPGKGTAGLTFTVDIGPFKCTYSGEGEITYEAEFDVVHWIQFPLTSASELCEPEEGFAVFHATKTTETPNGGPPIWIDA